MLSPPLLSNAAGERWGPERFSGEFHGRYERRLYAVAPGSARDPRRREDAVQGRLWSISPDTSTSSKIFEEDCLKIGPWAVIMSGNTPRWICCGGRNGFAAPAGTLGVAQAAETSEAGTVTAVWVGLHPFHAGPGPRGAGLRSCGKWRSGTLPAACPSSETTAHKRVDPRPPVGWQYLRRGEGRGHRGSGKEWDERLRAALLEAARGWTGEPGILPPVREPDFPGLPAGARTTPARSVPLAAALQVLGIKAVLWLCGLRTGDSMSVCRPVLATNPAPGRRWCGCGAPGPEYTEYQFQGTEQNLPAGRLAAYGRRV